MVAINKPDFYTKTFREVIDNKIGTVVETECRVHDNSVLVQFDNEVEEATGYDSWWIRIDDLEAVMDRADPMAENESTADTVEVEALYRREAK
jgi:hypothetical protein